jgi:short-subunit dehydrogenase
VELEGKRILISGATGGLGRAIAEQLAGNGARLVLSSRRETELGALARSLPGGEGRHDVLVADLAGSGTAERLIADAGDLDGLVANAALPGTRKLEVLSTEEIARTLRVNLEAPILMARELVPLLLEKGEGHLVFISSLNSKVATPRTSVYCATKFGLRGFALSLREDLYPEGIGVSIVAPGFVREAGMFHQSGGSAAGLGTTTPKKVAEGVIRAIRTNRSEIAVAPRRTRLAVAVAHRHPGLAARLQRRGGADRIADRIADGHAKANRG